MVFVLLLFLSRRAIRPFVENLERQRQFVTDASHELNLILIIKIHPCICCGMTDTGVYHLTTRLFSE